MRHFGKIGVALVVVFKLAAGCVGAEAPMWTQEIALRPGWNAVWLKVDVDSRTVDEAGLPAGVKIVLAWAPRPNTRRPTEPEPATNPGPNWLRFRRPRADDNTLLGLKGGTCYLIQLDDQAAATTWKVAGQPVAGRFGWEPRSASPIGVAVDPTHPPTFTDYFGAETSLRAGPFFRLGPTGTWDRVTAPDRDRLRDGEVVFATSATATDFAGPIRAEIDQRDGLDFGSDRSEARVRLRNRTPRPRVVQVWVEPTDPARAVVPLSLWVPSPVEALAKTTADSNIWTWQPLPGRDRPVALSLTANGWDEVRLAIRRGDMPRPGKDEPTPGALLRLRSDDGTLDLVVAVTAAPPASLDQSKPRRGLWVGWTTLTDVNRPSSGRGDSPEKLVLRPVARSFEQKLLVYVGDDGRASLLSQATEIWNPIQKRLLIHADEAGAALAARAGGVVGRRFHAATFSFRGPIALAPETDPPAAVGTWPPLTARVRVEYDDPRNPFVHPFHPDHDNRDERREAKLPEGAESYTIERIIRLEPRRGQGAGSHPVGWGDNELGGAYREEITRLHRDKLVVGGTFWLQRINSAADLAPASPPVAVIRTP